MGGMGPKLLPTDCRRDCQGLSQPLLPSAPLPAAAPRPHLLSRMSLPSSMPTKHQDSSVVRAKDRCATTQPWGKPALSSVVHYSRAVGRARHNATPHISLAAVPALPTFGPFSAAAPFPPLPLCGAPFAARGEKMTLAPQTICTQR